MFRSAKGKEGRERNQGLPSDRSLPPGRRSVLGVPFDLIDYRDVIDAIEAWRRGGERRYVTCTPPYSVMMSTRDPELAAATEEAGLVLPDGIGIIMAAKMLGYPNKGRVSGPTLMLKACDWGREHGYRHYFYGGASGVADLLAERLSQQYPGLEVAGTYCPPFRPMTQKEDAAVVEAVNMAKPDIVWVGLGSPKQEVWMREHAGRIRAAAMIGVGAAFDFHSGRARWAPRLLRGLGVEWAYRLANEPGRMWRRNVNSVVFIAGVFRQYLRHRTAADSTTGTND